MRVNRPGPDDILEELADKVAYQIERLATVAFDGALRELTRYHKFLLALSASRASDGTAFNFAEIAGNAWHAPHREWIRGYRRLFERAADRLGQDDHFIRALAYTPARLLPGSGEPELPPNIVKVILDLGPIMIHRLESWVTKRTTVETGEGEAAAPRLALAGSDAKAYANVMPDIVGAWEGLLHHVPSMFGWREPQEQQASDEWSQYRSSWSFLWQHLTNTAYCLAAAVWNEDEIGAAYFREALVRWPYPLNHRFRDGEELRHRRLVFPTILNVEWDEAAGRARALGYDYMPDPTPDQLFAAVIRGAHSDVINLTAALLLFWTLNDKQASAIGGRTARSLLRRETSDDEGIDLKGHDPEFHSLALDHFRLELAGGRYEDGSYAADLDHLVEILDNMTERRVVPGRVFTPTTLHGSQDLLIPMVAILVSRTPEDGDDGLVERLTALAKEHEILPEDDRSLRNILSQLGNARSALEQQLPQIVRGATILEPQREAKPLSSHLKEIVSSVDSAIETERLRRLNALNPDPEKLERIRSAIERTLLVETDFAFFRDTKVSQLDDATAAESWEFTFSGISKANLTEPEMDNPVSEFERWFANTAGTMASHHVWASFRRRARTMVDTGTQPNESDFWEEIAPLAAQIPEDPILLVSRLSEGGSLRRLLYTAPEERAHLQITRLPQAQQGAGYIATIEGIDVYGADFPQGMYWLFSAKALRSVEYAPVEQPNRYVELAYEPADDLKGTIRAFARQRITWDDSVTFEIRAPTFKVADETPT